MRSEPDEKKDAEKRRKMWKMQPKFLGTKKNCRFTLKVVREMGKKYQVPNQGNI
jgi:hypothetical protein